MGTITNKDIMKMIEVAAATMVEVIRNVQTEKIEAAFQETQKLVYEVKSLKRLLVAETGRQAMALPPGK